MLRHQKVLRCMRQPAASHIARNCAFLEHAWIPALRGDDGGEIGAGSVVAARRPTCACLMPMDKLINCNDHGQPAVEQAS